MRRAAVQAQCEDNCSADGLMEWGTYSVMGCLGGSGRGEAGGDGFKCCLRRSREGAPLPGRNHGLTSWV